MARIRTGNPNGRPPLAREERSSVVDIHIHVPVEIMDKIDRMRKGNETRKDVIVRLVEEAEEEV
jgi:hypothetical protein